MGMRRMLTAAVCTSRRRVRHTPNSICTFSGQNDDPNAPIVPPGPTAPNGPGGRTQSYGQDVRNGLSEPSAINPGKVGQGVLTFHPGFACNGDHGFFAEGGEE
jgi:hypothetical protein